MFLVICGLLLFHASAAQSEKPAMEPKFNTLSPEDATRLDRQRAVVLAAAKERYGIGSLTKTKADLKVLQRLIDDHVFDRHQTYELQCLGVVFADVVATVYSLRWVMVTDEYGTDPTLRLRDTSIQINALTMIAKRILSGETPDVVGLLEGTRKAIEKLDRNRTAEH
jgi:hypothetical protein